MKHGPTSLIRRTCLLAAVATTAATPVRAEQAPGDQAEPGGGTHQELKVQELSELSLEELLNLNLEVWSATKTRSRVEEVAAAVVVITARDIQSWGSESVASVLRRIPGFFIVDDYTTPNVGVRGVAGGLQEESGTLKVMVDGHSTAFRSTGGNWLGPELIPLSAVERIEVITGPASALYGADAFLGVINIVTREGGKLNGASLMAGTSYVASSPGLDAEVTGGTMLGKADVLLAYKHSSRDYAGLRLPDSSPAPRLEDTRGEPQSQKLLHSSHVGFPKLRYPLGKGSLTASSRLGLVDRDAELSPWIQLANRVDTLGVQSVNHVSLQQLESSLKLELPLSEELDLTWDSLYFQGAPTGRDRLDVGSHLYSLRRELGYRGVDSTLELKWQAQDSLMVSGGLGMILDREQLFSTIRYSKGEDGSLTGGEIIESASVRQEQKNFLNPSAYVQALWTPSERYLSVTAGARYDHHNIYGNKLTGRLGFVSNPLEALNLKLLYGSAFKAPTPLLLHAIPLRAGDIIGNPDLAAQFVHTWEGRASYKLSAHGMLSSAVSYSYLINKATFTSQGINKIARNMAAMGIWTWETGARGVWEPLEAYADVELTSGVRAPGLDGYQGRLLGTSNTIYPGFLSRAGVLGHLSRFNLHGSVQAVYTGPRTSSDDNTLEAGGAYQLPGFVTTDLHVYFDGLKVLKDRPLTLSATVQNVLNSQAANPGFAGVDYPVLPRTLSIQLRQNL